MEVYVGMPLLFNRAFGVVIGLNVETGVCLVLLQNGDHFTCPAAFAAMCQNHLFSSLVLH